MYKVLSSIFGWVKQDEDPLEEALRVLEAAEKEIDQTKSAPEPEDDTDYNCLSRQGKVTKVEGDKITIEDLYEFESPELEIPVGTTVSFIAYTEDKIVKVSNVTIVDNEWNCAEKVKSNWSSRTIISKVIRREGRKLIIDHQNMAVNLNNVSSEFVPIEGDWLQIEAKCIIDETVDNFGGEIIECTKISPMRPRITEGSITEWYSNDQVGQISNNIFFNRDALCNGYLPIVGDRVVTEIIESDQGYSTWRSIKIIPGTNKTVNLNSFQTDSEIKDLNIIFDEDVFVYFNKLNSAKPFEINLTNKNDTEITLNDVEIQTTSCEIKLDYPDKFPLVLKPNEKIIVLGTCKILTAGQSQQFFNFKFEHCAIKKAITVVLSDANNHLVNTARKTSRNYMANNRNFRNRNPNVMKAPRANNDPRFTKFRLPAYTVPDKLWDVLDKQVDDETHVFDEIKRVKGVLAKPLTFNFYEDRFHTLLYLEEIHETIQMRRYDQDRAVFIRNGEYLMLEIENLAEQRPSVVVGDVVVAYDPYKPDGHGIEGMVNRVGAKHLFLKFHNQFHTSYNGEDFSVHIKQSRTQIRRLHHAVSAAVRYLGRDILFPSRVVEKPLQVCFEFDESILKNGEVKARLSNSQLRKILGEKLEKDKQEKLELKLEWFNQRLNKFQKAAVINTLHGRCRPLPYIIYGPPGTGKTVTLVEIILQTLRMIPHSRIMVATPSNSAANLIATRLIESGVLQPGDLVRLVAYKCVIDDNIPPALAPYCATMSYALQGTGSRTSEVTSNGLTLGVDSSTIGRHRITISTCSTIGGLFNFAYPRGHFTHIMIDEAGQTIEPEVMIPMSFLDLQNGQCILAGDPQQLGPMVSSKYTKALGLGESYMERLINRFPYVRDEVGFPETAGYDTRFVSKLILNYRSLPKILHVPNKLFYHSELQSTISEDDSPESKMLEGLRPMLPSIPDNTLVPFIFHGVNGQNYQMADCPSWYNPQEVSQVFYYINQLYRLNLKHTDIGIITPYIKQVKEIRSILMEAGFDVPKVGTVEEFQGQEFNVIILSTVRATSDMVTNDLRHNLGFVSQPKRVNVALTRAKTLLIVIGNPSILIRDYCWRHIISYAVEIKSYLGCPLPDNMPET